MSERRDLLDWYEKYGDWIRLMAVESNGEKPTESTQNFAISHESAQ